MGFHWKAAGSAATAAEALRAVSSLRREGRPADLLLLDVNLPDATGIDVAGRRLDVRRPDGERVGVIERLMRDKVSGRVAYAVMSFGGFLGLGRRYHTVPWSVLSYSEEMNGYVIDRDRAMAVIMGKCCRGNQGQCQHKHAQAILHVQCSLSMVQNQRIERVGPGSKLFSATNGRRPGQCPMARAGFAFSLSRVSGRLK